MTSFERTALGLESIWSCLTDTPASRLILPLLLFLGAVYAILQQITRPALPPALLRIGNACVVLVLLLLADTACSRLLWR